MSRLTQRSARSAQLAHGLSARGSQGEPFRATVARVAAATLIAVLFSACATGGDPGPVDDRPDQSIADAEQGAASEYGGDSGAGSGGAGRLQGHYNMTPISIDSLACIADPSALGDVKTFTALAPGEPVAADGNHQEITIDVFDESGQQRQSGDGVVVQISLFDLTADLDLNLELLPSAEVTIDPPVIAIVGMAKEQGRSENESTMLVLEGVCRA